MELFTKHPKEILSVVNVIFIPWLHLFYLPAWRSNKTSGSTATNIPRYVGSCWQEKKNEKEIRELETFDGNVIIWGMSE